MTKLSPEALDRYRTYLQHFAQTRPTHGVVIFLSHHILVATQIYQQFHRLTRFNL